MADPLVSVIIPTYNYGQYIIEAINSVLAQTYTRASVEIIIVDDGSTDNTQQVLQPFIDSGEVIYHYQPNQGKASATSNAIQKSRGKYIFNLDADDYFFNDKIEKTVNVFESEPEIVHVASAASIFNDSTKSLSDVEKLPVEIVGKTIDGLQLLDYFYSNNILYGGGTTYAARASVLKKIDIPAGVDMYIDEFLILAILPFGKSFFIPAALSVWRVHGFNYSGKTNDAENRRQKNERLVKSSEAILNYLVENRFEKKIIDIYRIKDAIRVLAFKESLNRKTFKDIRVFAGLVFVKIRPDAKVIRKYQVLNRLIPGALFRLIKKVLK